MWIYMFVIFYKKIALVFIELTVQWKKQMFSAM